MISLILPKITGQLVVLWNTEVSRMISVDSRFHRIDWFTFYLSVNPWDALDKGEPFWVGTTVANRGDLLAELVDSFIHLVIFWIFPNGVFPPRIFDDIKHLRLNLLFDNHNDSNGWLFIIHLPGFVAVPQFEIKVMFNTRVSMEVSK